VYKNESGQKVAVFAWDTDADAPKTGDADNITARISKDEDGPTQSTDTNPDELSAAFAPGVYVFDVSQGETDCNLFILAALSSTANIELEPVIIYTVTDPTLSIPELTTGFSAVNNLNKYLAAIMGKEKSAPAGFSNFDPATDSIEAIRDLLDLMAGAGFNTSTDSLEAIRNAIDTLIAPSIVAPTSMSGSGFLSGAVSLVRQLTDEPSTGPKYTDTDIVEFLQAAFDTILADINVNTDHPLMVRHDITLVPGTLEYLLPPQVGEVWRVARIVDNGYVPLYEVYPDSHLSSHQSGFVIEGNVFRLLNDWQSTDTLQILFVPLGEPWMHYGDAAGFDTSLINSSYKWTDSVAVPNEYHVELAAGGDPSVSQPTTVYLAASAMTEGTLGSLAAGEWAYGDNDTLGYNTLYVRLSGNADPDTLTAHEIHTGLPTTITLDGTPTDGTLDTRANAYAGYMLRILADTNSVIQERVITSYNNLTKVATVGVPFNPTPYGATLTYEVIPQYSLLLKHVVCMQTAVDILGMEGNTKRMRTLGERLMVKMRALKMLLRKKSSRFPGHMGGDTSDNTMRGGDWGWLA
jgi:hypothetical protein